MSNPAPQQTYNQYKVRKLSWNKAGEVYGITLPRQIAIKFEGIKFTITSSGENIILQSGLDIVNLRKEIDSFDLIDG